jgi:subtilase family serine protease
MQTKATSLVTYFSALLILLFMSESLSGQTPKDRIVEAVDKSQATVLNGNVHPLARPQYDQGRVESSMPMRVTLVFKISAAEQADLDALLASQQDRGSPDYQRWLTPEQYGGRFGLSQGDLNKVTGWLESEGLQVESIPASQNAIVARGSAQQVAAALHTEIHRYVINGKTQFANSSSPSVPAALADAIAGIRGLNNFALKPRLVRKISPKFTSGKTGNHFVTPPDFATIYGLSSLYQQQPQPINGAGQKIVVLGQSDVALSDVRAFRTNSGLAANDPTPIDSNNSALVGLVVPNASDDPGMLASDIDEASLDVEWSGAIAPGATIIFVVGNPVNGGGVFDSMYYAITHSPILAPVISVSYGECEAGAVADGSYSGFYLPLLQQANAEGITVLGPSGDSGAADCDAGNTSVDGLAVDMPGSLPTVTSVGGTEFQEGADLAGTYWMNPWAGIPPTCLTSGTCTFTDILSSARSYIPEGAWNDTNAQFGLTAGGGGASSVIAKPAWQAGTGVPNDAARDVPDISFSASPVQDPYLICSEYIDPTSNQLTPWCTTNGFRNASTNAALTGELDTVGGTSVGPPAMAGILAVISQETNHTTGWGNINPILYPLAAHTPTAFHDVTIGNNQVPFSSACGAVSNIGFNAATGYDLATGLGSISALTLATNWTSVSPASTGLASTSANFSLAFSPTSLTVKRGSCLTGSVQVTRLNGFVGTPTFTCTASANIGGALAVPTACTVTQGVGTSLEPPRDYRVIGWWGTAGALLAAMAFILATSRRRETGGGEWRTWPRLIPGFAVVTLLAMAIGCGGSSSGNSSSTDPVTSYTLSVSVPSNAPLGTGSISVVGSIGTLRQSAGMTVTTQ